MAGENDAGEFLVNFLANFTALIEKELLAIRQNVVATVEAVMENIEEISQTVEKNKQDAEDLLEFTYLNPDPTTEILIEDVQKVADELIEGAYRVVEGSSNLTPDSLTTSEPEVVVQNRLNRFNVRLDHSFDRLNDLDSRLNASLLNIVGALSAEDLIAQRLEHTILSLKSLQTGLSFLLIDYEERCQADEVERVTRSILTFTYRQYTAEEEKERFQSIFGHNVA